VENGDYSLLIAYVVYTITTVILWCNFQQNQESVNLKKYW